MAGYGPQGISVQDALREAEREAVKLGDTNVDAVLAVARDEIVFPELAVVWEDAGEAETGDILFPYRKVAALLIDDSVEPQAVGHALVWASFGGHIHCVRKLREIQVDEGLTASILTARFTTYAILKAAEAGHVEVMRELLKTIGAGSLGFMGYIVTKNYTNNGYPFLNLPLGNASEDWLQRMASCKAMLPTAIPSLKSGEWDLQGLQGSDSVQQAIRASFGTYFLWRTALVAAANDHDAVLKELLKQREVENLTLAESFRDGAGKNGYEVEVKKIISSRGRIDTLMYQLVEELSTRQYHDAILHALWSHIQKGGRESPRATASRSRSVAQAQNGLWELQLEKPILRMSVEECYKEDEPFRRYKQLTELFNQRAKVNVQLAAAVEAMPTHLQVTVGIKHVRFKVENSRWDDKRMGHFPSLVSLSVRPETTEGTGVTMSNSSVNQSFKVGKAERIQAGVGIAGAMMGARGNVGVSAGVSMSTTVKNTPWRFEQLPMYQDRGGAFAWTLEAMKGQDFNRLNPPRMAATTSLWRFGKRIPGNPLSQLPFTSEGGIIFTNAKFDDTLIWRFPKSMEGTKLKWRIEGHVHCTYTSPRYWETRMQSFAGDIEETLVALEVKDKKDKDGGDEKKEKKDKKDKDGDEEKKEKKDKDGGDEKKEKKEKKEKGENDDAADGDGKAEKKEKKKKEEDDSVDGDEKAEKKKEKKTKVGADENVDGEEITKTKKEKKSEEGDGTVDNTQQKVEKKKTEDVDTKYAEYLEFLEWRKKFGKVEHDEDNVKPVKEKKEKQSKGAGDLDADAVPVNQGKEKKVEADHILIGNPNDHFGETAQTKETEVISSQVGNLIDFGDDIPAKEKDKTVKVDDNVSPKKNVPEVQGGEEVNMAASSLRRRELAVTVGTRDMTFSSQDSQFQMLDAMGGLKDNSYIGRETQSYELKKPPGWKAKVAEEERLDQEGAQLKSEEDSSSQSQRSSLQRPPGVSVRTRSRDFRFDNFST